MISQACWYNLCTATEEISVCVAAFAPCEVWKQNFAYIFCYQEGLSNTVYM